MTVMPTSNMQQLQVSGTMPRAVAAAAYEPVQSSVAPLGSVAGEAGAETVGQQQQQQQQNPQGQPASPRHSSADAAGAGVEGAAAKPAAAATSEAGTHDSAAFSTGQVLQLQPQRKDLFSFKTATECSYYLMVKGLAGQGGNADAYVVELVEMNEFAQRSADKEPRKKPRSKLGGRPRPLLSLRKGQLYVLKVGRTFQSYPPVMRAATTEAAFNARQQQELYQEREWYKELAETPNVVQCFGFGTAKVDTARTSAAAATTPEAAALTPGAAAGTAAGTADGEPLRSQHPCLLLEYATGGSLAQKLQPAPGQYVAMTQPEATTVMSHVCFALVRMHQLGFVYGDLQPGNVVLAQLPGEQQFEWHLLDIASIVQLKEGEQFKPHQECGTAAYRAPERREGHKFNSSADVYSLGMLLLQLRTGVYSFLCVPGDGCSGNA
jgi:hypothetical protein